MSSTTGIVIVLFLVSWILAVNVHANYVDVTNNTTSGSTYTTATSFPTKNSGEVFNDVAAETTHNEHKCYMNVSGYDRKIFQNEVLRQNYEIVVFRLLFDNVNVSYKADVFRSNSFIWSWMPRDSRIGSQYITWPFEYGVWSFGILSYYSRPGVQELHLMASDHCSNVWLRMGENITDRIVSEALASVSLGLAEMEHIYASSRLCYRILLPHDQGFWNYFCKNTFCPLSSNIARRCFTYSTQNNKAVLEEIGEYTEDFLLGIAPTVLGWILFLYFPLLLFKVLWWLYSSYTRVNLDNNNKNLIENGSAGQPQEDSSVEIQDSPPQTVRSNVQDFDLSQVSENEPFVYLTEESPITITSTVCEPCGNCHLRRSVLISRCVRLTFVIFTLSCAALEVLLDYRFALYEIRAAVKKEQNVGFRSMLAGINESRKSFLPIYGGPYMALCLYIISALLILVPARDLSNLLANGIPDHNTCFSSLTPLIIDIGKKERFGSVSISTKVGYYKVFKFLLAHAYMILNKKFWRYVITQFKERYEFKLWKNDKLVSNAVARKILSVILFIPYVIVCLCEIVSMVAYYGLPMVGFVVVTIRAFVIKIVSKVHSDESILISALGYILAILAALTVICSQLIFNTLFIDAFIFLSRILMFTYTGIIAYPKLSYGYIIFTFMSLYYMLESIYRYARFYLNLLKVTIAVVEDQGRETVVVNARLLSKANGLKGIPKGLFDFVIEHTKPRRILIFETLIRFATTLIVLAASISLIIKFEAVEDLHLAVHVLFAIFVCALPIVLRSVCNKNSKSRNKTLRRKVKRAVRSYCIENIQREVP